MRNIIIAAALLTLAGAASAQDSNVPLPDDWMPSKSQLASTGTDEPGRRLSCTSFNIFFGHLDDPALRNRIGDGIAALGEWCSAQPEAVRRKYGSRY